MDKNFVKIIFFQSQEPFWKDILLHFRHVTETEIDKANENGYYDIKYSTITYVFIYH